MKENALLKDVVQAQSLQLKRYQALLDMGCSDELETQEYSTDASGIWFLGTFLYLPSDSHLQPVISVLKQTNGKQRALALLTILLGQELSDTQRVSALLLLSTIMRDSYRDNQSGVSYLLGALKC